MSDYWWIVPVIGFLTGVVFLIKALRSDLWEFSFWGVYVLGAWIFSIAIVFGIVRFKA